MIEVLTVLSMLPCDTPVSQTHANPPHTNKICVGMVPMHKNLRGDVPMHSPHKIFHFFRPHRKTCIFSLQSPCIPTYPHTSPTTYFAWESVKIRNLHRIFAVPMLNFIIYRPHTNYGDWYPSPRKISSFRGSVRQGCL